MISRSHICLFAADGGSNNAIAKELGTSRPMVLLWGERFHKQGPWGLSEGPPLGPSAQPLDPKKVKAIVETTLQTTPPGATQWSTRTMAQKLGVSHSSVARIWKAHGLQPHRTKTFKLSKDKRFVEKLTDVVGLYLNPPDKILALCVD
jgi:transposase